MNIGDQWDLDVLYSVLNNGRITIEPALITLFALDNMEVIMQTPRGPLPLVFDLNEGVLRTTKRQRLIEKRTGSADLLLHLSLECRSVTPLLFELKFKPEEQLTLRSGDTKTEAGVQISFIAEAVALSGQGSREGQSIFASLPGFRLSLQAAQLSMVAGFDTLRCIPLLHDVELLDHQLHTARTVLQRLHGRALLCDEVGLGKTVEAGMILMELVMRGLVRRTLILTPPSLVEQWQGELQRKFGIAAINYDDPAFRELGAEAWGRHDHVIASYHTAKREPHRTAILAQNWDMMIIDEAHHFRNRQTSLWKFGAALRKHYTLLLTATPVQNSLEDLFNLVALLQPELLSTARSFQQQYIDRRDKLSPRNVDRLHNLLSEVMIRNRRATVGRTLPHRLARTETVALSDAERALYDAVSVFVRLRLRDATVRNHMTRMTLLTLQKALGSSSLAAAPMLERMALDNHYSPEDQEALLVLADTARNLVQHAKIERLLTLVHDLPDKVVIFTQFRETQLILQERLSAVGEEVVVFHGGLSRLQKEEMIRRFKGNARVLISTDAGSEGRNLQFCNVICNFDLPWNPMKIEQRIGRLSRIGQPRDVHIINLVAAQTLEASLLYLLDAKIAMFELVIGEIDMIIGNLDEEREFEDLVTDIWVETTDATTFHAAMDRLGERLTSARDTYLRQSAQEDKLFGDRFAAIAAKA